MPILKIPALFCCLVLLSACGGGGGDDASIALNNGDESDVTVDNAPTNNTPTDTTPVPEVESSVDYALRTGDASQITKAQLFTAINENAALAEENRIQTLNTIFNLNADGSLKSDSVTAIDWNPSHDSIWFESTRFGENFPFLISNTSFKNSDTQNNNLAMAGIKPNGARYIVMGANALSSLAKLSKPLDAGSQSLQSVMENSLDWLTQKTNFKSSSAKVVVAHQSESYWFNHDNSTHQWFADNYANASVNATDACESRALESCLENADLLVIGRDNGSNDTHDIEFDLDSVMESVKKAQEQGIPVLYLQYDGGMNDLGNELMTYFGLQTNDNYWRQEGLSSYTHDSETSKDVSLENVTTSINHLMSGNIDLDFNTENCPNDVCDTSEVIDNSSGLSMQELLSGAVILKDVINGFNANNINVFDNDSNSYEESKVIKLSILLADKFRQEVSYPMDKNTTDSNQFMQSLFADSIDYIARDINPAQADMGNFSSSDFSHITPINKTVTMTSKESFRATGVYALPGQTVEITRNDNSEVSTKIFINTLRSGATHEFATDRYNRPKNLRSTAIEVKSGDTIRMTSAYGGPMHIQFDVNDLDISLSFKNIGEHPFWKSSSDDERFAEQLDKGDYNWAELVTPGFEVHSKLDKMRDSMNDDKWGSAKSLADATTRYMHNFPHVLAGFKGPGIDVLPEIHDFANDKGWTIDNLDYVKHMNADQAACGYGCSGNPYDAYWSFSPIGHGDVHELGHGLQGSKRFTGWESHTMTNFYSYYTKTQYGKDTGADLATLDCQSLPFESMFDVLQQSVKADNPKAYMDENLWDVMSWSHGAGMFIQMMMAAEASDALDDGWLVRARLHILEREYNRAKSNETDWLAKRDSLGFSSYSLDDLDTLGNNEWYLIAISTVTERDYRAYFDMWGIAFDDKGALQVADYEYPEIPQVYYASGSQDYCLGLDKPTIAIDGNQVWPE